MTEAEEYRAQFAPSACITGQLLAPDGSPIPHWPLRYELDDPGGVRLRGHLNQHTNRVRGRTNTDGQGRFTLLGLEQGGYRFTSRSHTPCRLGGAGRDRGPCNEPGRRAAPGSELPRADPHRRGRSAPELGKEGLVRCAAQPRWSLHPGRHTCRSSHSLHPSVPGLATRKAPVPRIVRADLHRSVRRSGEPPANGLLEDRGERTTARTIRRGQRDSPRDGRHRARRIAPQGTTRSLSAPVPGRADELLDHPVHELHRRGKRIVDSPRAPGSSDPDGPRAPGLGWSLFPIASPGNERPKLCPTGRGLRSGQQPGPSHLRGARGLDCYEPRARAAQYAGRRVHAKPRERVLDHRWIEPEPPLGVALSQHGTR